MYLAVRRWQFLNRLSLFARHAITLTYSFLLIFYEDICFSSSLFLCDLIALLQVYCCDVYDWFLYLNNYLKFIIPYDLTSENYIQQSHPSDSLRQLTQNAPQNVIHYPMYLLFILFSLLPTVNSQLAPGEPQSEEENNKDGEQSSDEVTPAAPTLLPFTSPILPDMIRCYASHCKDDSLTPCNQGLNYCHMSCADGVTLCSNDPALCQGRGERISADCPIKTQRCEWAAETGLPRCVDLEVEESPIIQIGVITFCVASIVVYFLISNFVLWGNDETYSRHHPESRTIF